MISVNEKLLTDYYSKVFKTHKSAVARLHKIQQAKLGADEPRAYTKVTVSRNKKIPKLAWVCKITGTHYKFTIGSAVEIGEDCIIEGVWDGEFSKYNFHGTDLFYGSGAKFPSTGHIIFVPPKHCYEYLFVIHDSESNTSYVSNSMNYVIAQSGMSYKKLSKSLRSKNDIATKVGFDLYDQLVSSDKKYKFYRMMFYNFTVDSRGRFKIFPSHPKKMFKGFDDYKIMLSEKIQAIAENGIHQKRINKHKPLTLMSNGYDSPCVGVFASKLGYKDAATIDVVIKERSDSGELIGKKLGMNVEVVNHSLGSVVPDLSKKFIGRDADMIAEFVATPGLGDNVMLAPLEKLLANRIYLSGVYGDSVWRRPSRLLPGLPLGIPYNKSTTEFRLRVGYYSVPVPAFGARFVYPIKRMTHSKKMEKYTLRQRYDRPIPRRIVEEAGIPRGMFADGKSGTNPNVLNYEDLIVPSIEKIVKRYEYTNSDLELVRITKKELVTQLKEATQRVKYNVSRKLFLLTKL